MTANGAVTTNPVSITQASTDGGPISLVERDAHSAPTAQAAAAPRPPRTAITRRRDYCLAGAASHALHISPTWR